MLACLKCSVHPNKNTYIFFMEASWWACFMKIWVRKTKP